MTKIILCEGPTDLVLIGYYLIAVGGWVAHNNKSNKFKTPFVIPYDPSTQKVFWYSRGQDFLVIWAVGGISRFPSAMFEILMINTQVQKDWIDKIVVISDRDHEESEKDLISRLQEVFHSKNIVVPLENNSWNSFEQINEFGMPLTVEIACLVVPFVGTGAIETFMLNTLSENREEQVVIEHARNTVRSLTSEKYLVKQRDRQKAELGISLAIMYPEKVFSLIDELIKSIRWEEYKTVRQEFSLLDQL